MELVSFSISNSTKFGDKDAPYQTFTYDLTGGNLPKNYYTPGEELTYDITGTDACVYISTVSGKEETLVDDGSLYIRELTGSFACDSSSTISIAFLKR